MKYPFNWAILVLIWKKWAHQLFATQPTNLSQASQLSQDTRRFFHKIEGGNRRFWNSCRTLFFPFFFFWHLSLSLSLSLILNFFISQILLTFVLYYNFLVCCEGHLKASVPISAFLNIVDNSWLVQVCVYITGCSNLKILNNGPGKTWNSFIIFHYVYNKTSSEKI